MASIKQELIRSVFWSAVEKYSGIFVGLIVSMILARLLSPEEFGIIAVAMVIIAFLQMFCTLGIGPAIIQRDDLSQSDLNSIFTFTIIVGFFLALLLFSCSWSIASYYKIQQLVPVCQMLSVNLFFSAANMVPNALMNKNKRFNVLAKRTFILQLSSGLLSIFAALGGLGIYALLISPIISSIGIYVWNRFYYNVRLNRHFSMEPIKRIFSYSSYQFLFEFVNYFSRNLDKLLIGRFLGVGPLGIYEKSYRLMQLPMQNVTSVLNTVLQPVLKDIKNDRKEISKKYLKIVKVVASISFPLGVILSLMSKEIIRLFYGSNWDSAIPVFSILALSLPFQMIQSTSGSMFMVCDATKIQFWVGIRNTFTTVIGFSVSIFFFKTIVSMAMAWTITLYINFFITYWILFHFTFKEPVVVLYRMLLKPLLVAFLLYISYYIFDLFLTNDIELLLSFILKFLFLSFLSVVFSHILGLVDIFSMFNRITNIIKKK